jgi:hypothetical protein
MAIEISGFGMVITTRVRKTKRCKIQTHTNSDQTLHYSIIRQRERIGLPAEEAKDHVNVLLSKRLRKQVEVSVKSLVTDHLALTSNPEPGDERTLLLPDRSAHSKTTHDSATAPHRAYVHLPRPVAPLHWPGKDR